MHVGEIPDDSKQTVSSKSSWRSGHQQGDESGTQPDSHAMKQQDNRRLFFFTRTLIQNMDQPGISTLHPTVGCHHHVDKHQLISITQLQERFTHEDADS